jgi:hypothetical protein
MTTRSQPRKCRVHHLATILAKLDVRDLGGPLKHTQLAHFIDELCLLHKAQQLVQPVKFRRDLGQLLADVREGDIVAISDYRALGYYYVYERNGLLYVRATLHKSDYGSTLPHQAFKMLAQQGTEFFSNSDVHLCQIPIEVAQRQSWGKELRGIPELLWGRSDESVTIDDRSYVGELEYVPFVCRCGRA